ncbi:hypothetical protein [Flavobacterium psychrotrophum]|uniref:hypothetical protein n=1 Tax=Flavobacterium psychrotrophum TaxID=2294119 RepID=UPI000E30DBAD|nr:hypothetical protein [Flavobacterium psychrotrophum]
MKTNKLSDLTLEELNKQKSTLKGVIIGFSILFLFAFIVLFYLIYKNGNYVLLACLPPGIFAMLPAVMRLSQLNTEIKSRKSDLA